MKLAILCILAAPLLMAGSRKVRVAHIGLELDGSWSWIREVSLHPDAELVGVADPHPDLLERAKSLAGAQTRRFTGYVPMLDELKPEAVTVTVPNSRHLEVVRECAKRRIHVWFQKPMAATAPEAREMERLARTAGITLMISYHPLWSGPMRALDARLDAGDVGTIRRLEVHHAFSASKILSPYYERQFLDPSLHGGGALMDQGTYGIDYAVWRLGRPVRVFATAKTLKPRLGLQMEDEVWVTLDYPGATAVVYGGWWFEPDGPGKGFVSVSGTKGELRRNLDQVTYLPAADSSQAGPREPRPVPLPVVAADQRGGIAHFLDCIRTGKPIAAPHSASLNVIVNEVVDTAYESIRTGRAVALR